MDRPRARRIDPASIVAGGIVGLGLAIAVVLGNSAASGLASASGAPRPSTGTVAGGVGWEPLAWSPDGSTLLVERGDERGIVRDAGVERVDGAVGWWPSDDATLAVVSAEAGSLALRPSGGPEERVVAAAGIESVAWSADGQTWAVVAGEGILVGLVGGEGVLVSADHPPSLALSPAGERVAFARGTGAGARDGSLWILDLSADRSTWLASVVLGRDDTLAWSPSGRFLAFTARRDDARGLFLLGGRAAEPILVVPDAQPGAFSWSPDGRWLAAARVAESGPITELIAVAVAGADARLRSLGSGRAIAWGPDRGALTTTDASGGLQLIAADDGTSRVLASDARPACAPAASVESRRVAYCADSGDLRIIEVASP